MKNFKIEAQASLILEIINALKNSILGQGIRLTHHIKINRKSYNNTSIIFSRKDNEDIKTLDFFYLGLILRNE